MISMIELCRRRCFGAFASIYFFATIVIVVAFGTSLRGQSQDTDFNRRARLVIHETRVDLGDQVSGRVFFHDFVIANQGKEDLRLDLVSKSCSCTTSIISSSLISPGDTGTISLGYEPDAGEFSAGQRSFNVTLTTSDPYHETLELEVTANLRMPLWAEPDVLDFGVVAPSTHNVSKAFELKWAEMSRPKIDVVLARPVPWISLRCVDLYDEDRPSIMRIEVNIDTSKMLDDKSTWLKITSDDNRVQAIEIPIRYELNLPIRSNPERLFAGALDPVGQLVEFKLLLMGNVETLSRVAKIVSDDARFSGIVDLSTISNGELPVSILFTPGEPQGRIEQILRIETRDGELLGRIPVHGMVR